MHGAFLAKNPHSSFFYLFTGLHAAHLIGGLVVLFVVVLGKSKRRELVDVATQYWHFLGVLWIALFWVLMTRVAYPEAMREAVIVASSRTGLAKSFRGSFNMTRPDDLAAHCIQDVLRKTPQARSGGD